MKNLLILVLVLVVAVAALGYWQGWFRFTPDDKVQIDAEKFKKDRATFSTTVGEKAKAIKDQFASLWKKSDGLTEKDKAQVQEELGELKKKHERIEQQLKELEETGQERFESLKQDLSKNLEEVDTKIEKLTKKLEKGEGK